MIRSREWFRVYCYFMIYYIHSLKKHSPYHTSRKGNIVIVIAKKRIQFFLKTEVRDAICKPTLHHPSFTFFPLFPHSPNENYPIVKAKILSIHFHSPSFLLAIHFSRENKSHKRWRQTRTRLLISPAIQPNHKMNNTLKKCGIKNIKSEVPNEPEAKWNYPKE